MLDDPIRRIEAALAEGTFDFGQLCCKQGEWSGSPDEPPVCCGRPLSCADDVRALLDRLKAAEGELETERMRLAACGVAALANTPKSAAAAREMLPEYRSASLDDVEHAVAEQMRLRSENERLRAEVSAVALPPALRLPEPMTEDEISDRAREMVKGGKSVDWLARAIEDEVLRRVKEANK